jgi:hypothetical protein
MMTSVPLSGEGRHYAFPAAAPDAGARPVSPFRLPPEIELSLWVPVRPFPRSTGARLPPRVDAPDA